MTPQLALEVPLEALGLVKEDAEVSLFLAIAALGRTLQQLLLLEEERQVATPGTLGHPHPLVPSPGAAQQQRQLAHCLQSLFSASIQLRQFAELNQAAAQELSMRPTCLELALERQVLSQLELQLSERAATLCASRGRALLPPFSGTVNAVKGAAQARLLEIHSGRLLPRLLPPLQPEKGPVPSLTVGKAGEWLMLPASPLPPSQGTACPGVPLLPGGLAGDVVSSRAAGPPGGAGAGAVGNDFRAGMHRPGIHRPSGIPLLLQPTTRQHQRQQWEGTPCWRPQTPPHAQPGLQLLPLPKRALPPPQLTAPILPLPPWPATQPTQQQQQQQEQLLLPSVSPPRPISTRAANRVQQLLAHSGPAQLPAAQLLMPAPGNGSQLQPGRAGAGQPQALGQQGVEGGRDGHGVVGAAVGGGQAAEKSGNYHPMSALLAKWSALRGDAAPSTSTEGSDPSQPSWAAPPLSPGATTASAAALVADGSLGAVAHPLTLAVGQGGGRLGPALVPSAAMPPLGAALPLPQRQPHCEQQQQQVEDGGGGASQLGSMLQCTLRPLSRVAAPKCAAQRDELAAQEQGLGPGLLEGGSTEGQAGSGFRFPAIPSLPEAMQIDKAGSHGAGQAGSSSQHQPQEYARLGAGPGASWGPLFPAGQGGSIAAEASEGAAAAGAPLGEAAGGASQGAASPAVPSGVHGSDGKGGKPAAASPPQLPTGRSPPAPAATAAACREVRAKAGRQGAPAAAAAAGGARRENNENFNSSQSQEEQVPVTQPAEPEWPPAAAPPSPPSAGAHGSRSAAAALVGGGRCCEQGVAGGQQGLASVLLPDCAGALLTSAELPMSGVPQPGAQQQVAPQQAAAALVPVLQPWASGATGAMTPAAAALLLDSQRDSNSPHRKPGLPGSGGKGSGGSGRCNRIVPHPLGPAAAGEDAAGGAAALLHALPEPAWGQGLGPAGPGPAQLAGLLSAVATRKRPLSQDADVSGKRSRFAIESQEAPEQQGEERVAAAGPAGSPAGSPAGGAPEGRAAEAGGGACVALPGPHAAAAVAVLGPGWAAQLGSEGEAGIMCTQPPLSSQERPLAGISHNLHGLMPPGATQPASGGPAPLAAAAWTALALAEHWASAGTQNPPARGSMSVLNSFLTGHPQSGVSPLASAGAGHPATAWRAGSSLAQLGTATPGGAVAPSSLFAGAAKGATPRFISCSPVAAASHVAPGDPDTAALPGLQQAGGHQAQHEASPGLPQWGPGL